MSAATTRGAPRLASVELVNPQGIKRQDLHELCTLRTWRLLSACGRGLEARKLALAWSRWTGANAPTIGSRPPAHRCHPAR